MEKILLCFTKASSRSGMKNGRNDAGESWPFGAEIERERERERERETETDRQRDRDRQTDGEIERNYFRLCVLPALAQKMGRCIVKVWLSPRTEMTLSSYHLGLCWVDCHSGVWSHPRGKVCGMARQREVLRFSFLGSPLFLVRCRWTQKMVGVWLGSIANESCHG
jgi:hypothetical protein